MKVVEFAIFTKNNKGGNLAIYSHKVEGKKLLLFSNVIGGY